MLTFTELSLLQTYEERLAYLQLDSLPGDMTFGPLREINQKFYRSSFWKQIRQAVIGRDLGFDLGVPGREIFGRVIIHHINPLTPKDIYTCSPALTDLDNLISVSHTTHQAIHFGSNPQDLILVERQPGDTNLWRPYGNNTQ